MKPISLSQSARIFARGLTNYISGKPLVISFETTHSCTCNCRHCDRGGKINEENRLTPEGFAKVMKMLRPAVIQLSGGESLLRDDLCDAVRAMKSHPYKLPHVILVSNASLLNRERYVKLKEAGVNRISISLDFPDERHDDFRRHPGLFAHLEKTLPALANEFNNKDIAVNTAITRANLPYLIDIVNKAQEWGIFISFSAYGVLRTGDEEFFISSEEDLKLLRQQLDEIIKLKKENGHILNSPYTLNKTYEFFKNGSIPDCKAGLRFLVVRPNGKFVPCSMMPQEKDYATQEELKKEFTDKNTCGQCYVAIRSYSDKNFGSLMKDVTGFFFANVLRK